MSMRSRISAIMTLAAMGDIGLFEGESISNNENPIKKCLVCKKEHNHNNWFCSPKCSKIYKNKEN